MRDSLMFNAFRGDRVARTPEGIRPTTSWAEAVAYANMRAIQTGRRQQIRRHNKHGWWLTICIPDLTNE